MSSVSSKGFGVKSVAERVWREDIKNWRAQETDWVSKASFGKETEGDFGGANGKFQELEQQIQQSQRGI